MKIWINNEKKEMPYDEICHTLGFSPEVKFVKVTNAGSISFTIGKPEEIRHLHWMCKQNGFRISKKLEETIKRI